MVKYRRKTLGRSVGLIQSLRESQKVKILLISRQSKRECIVSTFIKEGKCKVDVKGYLFWEKQFSLWDYKFHYPLLSLERDLTLLDNS